MELQVRLGRADGSAAHREAVTGHVLMIRSFEVEGVEGEIYMWPDSSVEYPL
jgi:hypothetical protein